MGDAFLSGFVQFLYGGWGCGAMESFLDSPSSGHESFSVSWYVVFSSG